MEEKEVKKGNLNRNPKGGGKMQSYSQEDMAEFYQRLYCKIYHIFS
jgi:hypothetical protein